MTISWGACSTNGQKNTYRFLVGKPEGKRPLGRPRHRRVDNIKMDPAETACGFVEWFGLAQDRYKWRAVVNAVMNFRVPQHAVELPSGLSSGARFHRVS
jgi:hypothetical protein